MRVLIHPLPGMPRPGDRIRRFFQRQSLQALSLDRTVMRLHLRCISPGSCSDDSSEHPPEGPQRAAFCRPETKGSHHHPRTPVSLRSRPTFSPRSKGDLKAFPLRSQSTGPGPIIPGPIMPEPITGQEPIMPMPIPRPIPPKLLITGYMRSASASCIYMFTCSR